MLYDTAGAFEEAGPVLTALGAPAWVGPATTTMGKALDEILDWADDDLLGSETYAYSSAYLTDALPSRGLSVTDTRRYDDGDATYTLTTRITRIV